MLSLFHRSKPAAILALLAATAFISEGQAETATKPAPTATPAAVSDEPTSTTASYGDWVVRCQRAVEGDKAVKICEAAQSVQVQGQNGPIAEIAIGRLAGGDPLHATVLLPNNIAFPSNVHIVVDEKDDAGVDLAWRRCVAGGCLADAALDADTVKRWRGRGGSGKLSFKDANGRVVALPFSFRGLPQALDALAKETHAAPPPAP
jgi:invasion protein IalB